MVPSGSQNETENGFWPGNVGFSHGVTLCVEGVGCTDKGEKCASACERVTALCRTESGYKGT